MSTTADRPLALVYRGRATTPYCPESAAAMMRAAVQEFDVRFVGEREVLKLTPQVLRDAAVYVQPGGGSLRPAWRRMRKHRETIASYVDGGGRYLGICLGGYLAGATPGFNLLPGDTDRYIDSPNAPVRTARSHVSPISWRGREVPMYVEDGPTFIVDDAPEQRVQILGRYPNGAVAALCAPYGTGRVGVIGPHPEADRSWYLDDGLVPGSTTYGVGFDLIDAVMADSVRRRPVGEHRPHPVRTGLNQGQPS